MLVLSIYDKVRPDNHLHGIKILDTVTNDVIAIRLVKIKGSQHSLGFQAPNKYKIQRFMEGTHEDPFNGVKNEKNDTLQDYEKLRMIRKILSEIKINNWDNPISHAYLKIAKIIDNE